MAQNDHKLNGGFPISALYVPMTLHDQTLKDFESWAVSMVVTIVIHCQYHYQLSPVNH